MDGVLITGIYYSKILCKDYFLKSKTGTKIETILSLCKCTTGIIILKKGFFFGGGVVVKGVVCKIEYRCNIWVNVYLI